MRQTIMFNGRKVELDEKTIANTKLLTVLQTCRSTGRRYRFYYGDTETGRSWNEEHDTMGYLSTSTGDTACLILVPTRRSCGGGALLDSCIIRIDDTLLKRRLYCHDKFHSTIKQVGNECHDTKDNTVYSRHDHPLKARKMEEFMRGMRYSK